ncbi:Smr/MutS family protein [Ruegeria pomeroyi]|uniref:Smr/MutS family protein n=1 Tax=Ruegeria alba TaxID=2916756 RepID=A0ABS9NYI1_9RHOB|nr:MULTISPECIES: Smr/MutS family protein [Ruegeria]MCE8507291.1 Smr/MutS family protein [Ruegeria pomeroyi]MCE8513098.1 Smr/MutS family protein [Ruegeria pomeroyi]MCE8518615.1 Smr/MutS family protein [Ruegeria pomeroyi]MCE8522248.1 Smr/MutS family protein [Ruegeria pomeroyi]MCE8526525.1 Smr/MutS family protein [Ruegeria pomeroyi]
MTRRKLTRDEIDLWRKVVRQADRLHPERVDGVHPQTLPKPKPTKPLPMSLEPFELGQAARVKSARHVLTPSVTDRLSRAPVQMDPKAYTRMRRGKLKPEGKLDLHGMRVDTAHPALTRFILTAQAQGKRLVLVVTGKGKYRDEPGPIPTPRGVLRHQVPQWLSLPPLAQAVLQVTPAHISHGGEGAYYVYLRRNRG